MCAGVYTTGPLTINISGVAALNPAMAGQVQTNPALAGLMYGSINEAVVPIEEGWVKLRGLDPAIGKQDICTFFQVSHPLCGEQTEARALFLLVPLYVGAIDHMRITKPYICTVFQVSHHLGKLTAWIPTFLFSLFEWSCLLHVYLWHSLSHVCLCQKQLQGLCPGCLCL